MAGNKFYVTRIMTNQREYGPLFFQKISKVIDSLNQIPTTKLQGATIGETFTAFQSWQITSGLDYSQWLCGQTATYVENIEANDKIAIYPNPFNNTISIDIADPQAHQVAVFNVMGERVFVNRFHKHAAIDLSSFSKGLYFLRLDNKTIKISKE